MTAFTFQAFSKHWLRIFCVEARKLSLLINLLKNILFSSTRMVIVYDEEVSVIYGLQFSTNSIHISFLLNLFYFIFLELRGRCSDFPSTLCLCTCRASPFINNSHQRGAFITREERTLTHLNHLAPLVSIGVHSWRCTFQGFCDKCLMTCIHHYNIVETIFPALQILCARLFFSPLPLLATSDLFLSP